MRKVQTRNRFKKDMKQMAKRGKPLYKLKCVIQMLVDNKPLDKRLLDHNLCGNYVDCRECHIEPDWLLIYRIEADMVVLIRTGTHSDLFN